MRQSEEAGYSEFFGQSDQELERLTLVGRRWEPFTRQVFQEAGLAPGMRVLDVGSGPGDVAFLAAEMVAPGGEVLGVELQERPVLLAEHRARALRLTNVRFEIGDVRQMRFDRPFDAVVGRLILMHIPEPDAFLKMIAEQVRPGGLLIFHEMDTEVAESFPRSATAERCHRWAEEAITRAGSDLRMGMKLYSTFLAAGLPAPQLRVDASIGGAESQEPKMVAGMLRTVLPLIERFGIATREEMELETVEERIRNELRVSNGVIRSPAIIGAWTRRP